MEGKGKQYYNESQKIRFWSCGLKSLKLGTSGGMLCRRQWTMGLLLNKISRPRQLFEDDSILSQTTFYTTSRRNTKQLQNHWLFLGLPMFLTSRYSVLLLQTVMRLEC